MHDLLPIDLVIFDMDGVIFEGANFWLELHRAVGTEAEAWALWNVYGRTDYARLSKITVEKVWRGRDAGSFFDLIRSRRYVSGAPELVEWLRARGIQTAIVSSGPYQLAERAQGELGIDRVLANRVLISDHRFAGTVEVSVDENHKDEAALRIIKDLEVRPERVAIIGDSVADVQMAKVVGLSLAYDPDPEMAAAAYTILPAGHLRDAARVIESWRPN